MADSWMGYVVVLGPFVSKEAAERIENACKERGIPVPTEDQLRQIVDGLHDLLHASLERPNG